MTHCLTEDAPRDRGARQTVLAASDAGARQDRDERQIRQRVLRLQPRSSVGRSAGHPKPFTQRADQKVSYITSDRPLTVEEWEAKHCAGNSPRA
jgi:hypothetical protein